MARNTPITLGEYFDGFVEDLIKQGLYQTVNEVVRDALRKLEQKYQKQDKLEALRAKLEKGENSPVVEDFDPEKFRENMRRKHG
ncbi:type II toxin-antitoxin system ParD family antitoxin [Endozoicomonas sp. 4G]|uniref:type II toxin-antitoxin system ParD family antitoxin n=1 Tax=Endozoicomonas sp. 4G TaxID=2872754 RepID=UPI0020791604|nr:type II toxin-antitoxin system ParD family antitoxin [Endozoicomonas sp. 4G]